MSNFGVMSMGVKLPLVREGDNLEQIIIDSIPISYIKDNSVIGITESIVARAQGNYVTVDEVAEEIKRVMNNPAIITVCNCIYSRNRFAMILKAIARAAGKRVIIYMPRNDEVGNTRDRHPFTNINYGNYYKGIVEAEGKDCTILPWEYEINPKDIDTIYCGLHDYKSVKQAFPRLHTLADFFSDKCKYGLLGSNKSTEEKLKLFPNTETAQKLCDDIKAKLKLITGRDVIVCVYGDGCFKDPVGGIWEFADPVTMPAYTDKSLLQSSPNEVKLKAILDEGKTDKEVNSIIKHKDDNLTGDMLSQGTTPRKYRDLLASLMDLTSGSGDKGTPVVLINNYFNNYTTK